MYELSIKETEVIAGGEVFTAAAAIVAVGTILYLGGPTYFDEVRPVYAPKQDKWGNIIYDNTGYPIMEYIGDEIETYRKPGFLW